MFGISKKSQGFTILELVIALMILAIIAGIVAPNLFRRRSSYARQELSDKLTGLVELAYLEGSSSGKLHRVFFDIPRKLVRLERETTRKHAGQTVYEPAKSSYLKTSFDWPEHFDIKNFYIKARDEMAAGPGATTNTVWFYVAPDGVAQEVIININDTNELTAQGNPYAFSLVLNPFTLRFTLYDEFQKP